MTTYYRFDNTKNDGQPLHGAEWDILVEIVDSQLQGALALHGARVAAIPDKNSLLVEAGNDGLYVHPGAALLWHSVYGYAWAKITAPVVLPLAACPDLDGDQNFVHMAIRVAQNFGEIDTRQSGVPLFAVSSSNQLDGGVLLAQVEMNGGAVVDVRDARGMVGTGSGSVLTQLFGSGRVVGFDRENKKPFPREGALGVVLPVGSSWFVEDRFVTLTEEIDIEVPDDLPEAGAWGLLSFDDLGALTVNEWLEDAPPRGFGVLGLVKASASEVLSVENTQRDIIQTEPGHQTRFEAIETAIEVLSGTGQGGVTEVTLAAFNALKAMVEDLARQLRELRDSIGGGAPLAVRLAGRVETLRAEHSRLAGSVVRLSPSTARRLRSSVYVAGLAGDAEQMPVGTGRAVYLGGNLHVNRAKRRLE